MRAWVWGGCLAAVTAGGVYFVFAGAGSPSHCGPCVACAKAASEPAPQSSPASTPQPAVEVVDLSAALAPRPVNDATTFVSFDEPAFANPVPAAAIAAPPPMVMPAAVGVVQAGFVAIPVDTAPPPETAPMPRRGGGRITLAGPGDRF